MSIDFFTFFCVVIVASAMVGMLLTALGVVESDRLVRNLGLIMLFLTFFSCITLVGYAIYADLTLV